MDILTLLFWLVVLGLVLILGLKFIEGVVWFLGAVLGVLGLLPEDKKTEPPEVTAAGVVTGALGSLYRLERLAVRARQLAGDGIVRQEDLAALEAAIFRRKARIFQSWLPVALRGKDPSASIDAALTELTDSAGLPIATSLRIARAMTAQATSRAALEAGRAAADTSASPGPLSSTRPAGGETPSLPPPGVVPPASAIPAAGDVPPPTAGSDTSAAGSFGTQSATPSRVEPPPQSARTWTVEPPGPVGSPSPLVPPPGQAEPSPPAGKPSSRVEPASRVSPLPRAAAGGRASAAPGRSGGPRAAPPPRQDAPPTESFLQALTREAFVRWIEVLSGLFILVGVGMLVSLVSTYWVGWSPAIKSMVLLAGLATFAGGALAAVRQLGMPRETAAVVGWIGLAVLPVEALAVVTLGVPHAPDYGVVLGVHALVLGTLAPFLMRAAVGESWRGIGVPYIAVSIALAVDLGDVARLAGSPATVMGFLFACLMAAVWLACRDLARERGELAFGPACGQTSLLVFLLGLAAVNVHASDHWPIHAREVGLYIAYGAWIAATVPAVTRRTASGPTANLEAVASIGAHAAATLAVMIAWSGQVRGNQELIAALVLLVAGMGASAWYHRQSLLAGTSAAGLAILYAIVLLTVVPQDARWLPAYVPLSVLLVAGARLFHALGEPDVAVGYSFPAMASAAAVAALGFLDQPAGVIACSLYAILCAAGIVVFPRRIMPVLAQMFGLLAIVQWGLPDPILGSLAAWHRLAVGTSAYALVLSLMALAVGRDGLDRFEESRLWAVGKDPLGDVLNATAAIAACVTLTQLPAVVETVAGLRPGLPPPRPDLAIAPVLLALTWRVERWRQESSGARLAMHGWIIAALLWGPFLAAPSPEAYRCLVALTALAYTAMGAYWPRVTGVTRTVRTHMSATGAVVYALALVWIVAGLLMEAPSGARAATLVVLALTGPLIHRNLRFHAFLYVSPVLLCQALVDAQVLTLTRPWPLASWAISALALAAVTNVRPVRDWIVASTQRHGGGTLSRLRLLPPLDVAIAVALLAGFAGLAVLELAGAGLRPAGLLSWLLRIDRPVPAFDLPVPSDALAAVALGAVTLWLAGRLYRRQSFLTTGALALASAAVLVPSLLLEGRPVEGLGGPGSYPVVAVIWGIVLRLSAYLTGDMKRRKLMRRGAFGVLALAVYVSLGIALMRAASLSAAPVPSVVMLADLAAAVTILIASRTHRGHSWPVLAAAALWAFHLILWGPGMRASDVVHTGILGNPTGDVWLDGGLLSVIALSVATEMAAAAILLGHWVEAPRVEETALVVALLGLITPVWRVLVEPDRIGWMEAGLTTYVLFYSFYMCHRRGGAGLTVLTAFLSAVAGIQSVTAVAHGQGILFHRELTLAFEVFATVFLILSGVWHGIQRRGQSGADWLLAPLANPQAQVCAFTLGLLGWAAALLGAAHLTFFAQVGLWSVAGHAVGLALLALLGGLLGGEPSAREVAGLATLWAGALVAAALAPDLRPALLPLLIPMGIVAVRGLWTWAQVRAQSIGLGEAAGAAIAWGGPAGLLLATAAALIPGSPGGVPALVPGPLALIWAALLLAEGFAGKGRTTGAGDAGAVAPGAHDGEPDAHDGAVESFVAAASVLFVLSTWQPGEARWAPGSPMDGVVVLSLAALLMMPLAGPVSAPVTMAGTLAALSAVSVLTSRVLGLGAGLPIAHYAVGAHALSGALLAVAASAMALGMMGRECGRAWRTIGTALTLVPAMVGWELAGGVPDGPAHGMLAVALALGAWAHLARALATGSETWVYTAEVQVGLVYGDLLRAHIIGHTFWGLLVLQLCAFALLGVAELSSRAAAGDARLGVLVRPTRNTALVLPLVVALRALEYQELMRAVLGRGVDEALLMGMAASFYAIAGRTLGERRWVYVAAVGFNAALFLLFWRFFKLSNLDFYTIPAGLTVLWYGRAQSSALDREQRATVRLVGLLVMFLAPTVSCVTQFDSREVWVLLVGGTIALLLGVLLSIRNFFFGGAVMLAVALLTRILHWAQALDTTAMVAFLALGAGGLIVGAVLRTYRAQIDRFVEITRRWE